MASAAKVDMFSPLTIKGVTFKNRIGIPPMCVFSAVNGLVNDFHIVHYGTRAIGGVGLIIVEATGVAPEGRITPSCLGIWSDEFLPGLTKLAATIQQHGAVPGIQIAHAGRKASTSVPWNGRGAALTGKDGWQVVAPSPLAWSAGSPVPHELTKDELHTIAAQFAAGAKRALQAGFKVIEVHAAHGYLLNEFLSPLTNQRSDEYGGSFENRIRLLCDVVKAIRKEMATQFPLIVRVSCVEWDKNGWNMDDSVKLAAVLKALDVDMMDCSSGGNIPTATYNPFTAYQVPFADQIRKQTGMATAAVGMLIKPADANVVITEDKADMVLIGREILRSPNWPMLAARELARPDAEKWIPQYAWCLGPKK